MIGGSSEPYEINLQNGDVISITVKRPQFLLTKLKKRTEYLYSLGGSIEDYTVDKLVNTIFAFFTKNSQIDDFIDKLEQLINTYKVNGVKNQTEQMYIIGLDLLLSSLKLKQRETLTIQQDAIQMEQQYIKSQQNKSKTLKKETIERLNTLQRSFKNANPKRISKTKLTPILEDGGKKTARRMSRKNGGRKFVRSISNILRGGMRLNIDQWLASEPYGTMDFLRQSVFDQITELPNLWEIDDILARMYAESDPSRPRLPTDYPPSFSRPYILSMRYFIQRRLEFLASRGVDTDRAAYNARIEALNRSNREGRLSQESTPRRARNPSTDDDN